MGEVLSALLDLVLPQSCAGCAVPARRWCPACAEELGCWAATPLGVTAPDPAPPGFPRAAAAAPYDAVVRRSLLAYKEQGRRGLARPLGALLAAAVLELGSDASLVLVPVPSTRAAVRRRGYDHSHDLARAAAVALAAQGRRVQVVRGLLAGRRLADQAGLGAAARAANLAGALHACERSTAGLRRAAEQGVVVVDDVVTTGTTAAEAARALRSAGVPVAGAATVAATRRRGFATVPGRSGT